MIFSALVIILILSLIFSWALGRAQEQQDLFMVASSTGNVHVPSALLEDEIESVATENQAVFDETAAPGPKEGLVPPASDRQIRACSTCGRLGRRRRNGKPFCFDCEHEPWLWE